MVAVAPTRLREPSGTGKNPHERRLSQQNSVVQSGWLQGVRVEFTRFAPNEPSAMAADSTCSIPLDGSSVDKSEA